MLNKQNTNNQNNNNIDEQINKLITHLDHKPSQLEKIQIFKIWQNIKNKQMSSQNAWKLLNTIIKRYGNLNFNNKKAIFKDIALQCYLIISANIKNMNPQPTANELLDIATLAKSNQYGNICSYKRIISLLLKQLENHPQQNIDTEKLHATVIAYVKAVNSVKTLKTLHTIQEKYNVSFNQNQQEKILSATFNKRNKNRYFGIPKGSKIYKALNNFITDNEVKKQLDELAADQSANKPKMNKKKKKTKKTKKITELEKISIPEIKTPRKFPDGDNFTKISYGQDIIGHMNYINSQDNINNKNNINNVIKDIEIKDIEINFLEKNPPYTDLFTNYNLFHNFLSKITDNKNIKEDTISKIIGYRIDTGNCSYNELIKFLCDSINNNDKKLQNETEIELQRKLQYDEKIIVTKKIQLNLLHVMSTNYGFYNLSNEKILNIFKNFIDKELLQQLIHYTEIYNNKNIFKERIILLAKQYLQEKYCLSIDVIHSVYVNFKNNYNKSKDKEEKTVLKNCIETILDICGKNSPKNEQQLINLYWAYHYTSTNKYHLESLELIIKFLQSHKTPLSKKIIQTATRTLQTLIIHYLKSQPKEVFLPFVKFLENNEIWQTIKQDMSVKACGTQVDILLFLAKYNFSKYLTAQEISHIINVLFCPKIFLQAMSKIKDNYALQKKLILLSANMLESHKILPLEFINHLYERFFKVFDNSKNIIDKNNIKNHMLNLLNNWNKADPNNSHNIKIYISHYKLFWENNLQDAIKTFLDASKNHKVFFQPNSIKLIVSAIIPTFIMYCPTKQQPTMALKLFTPIINNKYWQNFSVFLKLKEYEPFKKAYKTYCSAKLTDILSKTHTYDFQNIQQVIQTLSINIDALTKEQTECLFKIVKFCNQQNNENASIQAINILSLTMNKISNKNDANKIRLLMQNCYLTILSFYTKPTFVRNLQTNCNDIATHVGKIVEIFLKLSLDNNIKEKVIQLLTNICDNIAKNYPLNIRVFAQILLKWCDDGSEALKLMLIRHMRSDENYSKASSNSNSFFNFNSKPSGSLNKKNPKKRKRYSNEKEKKTDENRNKKLKRRKIGKTNEETIGNR
jgi:hypothetical protein